MRHAAIAEPFRQPGAIERLKTFGALHDDTAARAGTDHGPLFAHSAGGEAGPGQRHFAAQIGIDKPRWRKQPRVPVLFLYTLWKAGDDCAFGKHSFGYAFEPDQAFTGRNGEGAGFCDQCVTARPILRNRRLAALRCAIDGQADRLGCVGSDHVLGKGRGRESQP